MQHISDTIRRSGGGGGGDGTEDAAALAGASLRQTRISFSNPISISTTDSPPASSIDSDAVSESVSGLSNSLVSQPTARGSVVGRSSVAGRMSIIPNGTFGSIQNYRLPFMLDSLILCILADSISHEGYCLKKAVNTGKTRLFDSWKRRYMVLVDNILYYADNREDIINKVDPKGFFAIKR